jgi:hypothetical protein
MEPESLLTLCAPFTDAIYDCSSLYQKNYRISGVYKLPPDEFLGTPELEVRLLQPLPIFYCLQHGDNMACHGLQKGKLKSSKHQIQESRHLFGLFKSLAAKYETF